MGCSPWGHKESDTTERLSVQGGSRPMVLHCRRLLSRGHLANVWIHYWLSQSGGWGVEHYWHLWKRPRMLLNIPKRTGEPLTMKNYLSQKSVVPRLGNPVLGESLLSTTTTVCTTNSVLAFIIF